MYHSLTFLSLFFSLLVAPLVPYLFFILKMAVVRSDNLSMLLAQLPLQQIVTSRGVTVLVCFDIPKDVPQFSFLIPTLFSGLDFLACRL